MRYKMGAWKSPSGRAKRLQAGRQCHLGVVPEKTCGLSGCFFFWGGWLVGDVFPNFIKSNSGRAGQTTWLRWRSSRFSFRSFSCNFMDAFIFHLPPRKLTWNLKMMVSNRNLLFQGFIFRFHVRFLGCRLDTFRWKWMSWTTNLGSWTLVLVVWKIDEDSYNQPLETKLNIEILYESKFGKNHGCMRYGISIFPWHDGINNDQPISHTTSTFLWLTRDWQVPQACWEQVPCARGGTCLQHRNTRKQGTSKWIGLEKVTRTHYAVQKSRRKTLFFWRQNLWHDKFEGPKNSSKSGKLGSFRFHSPFSDLTFSKMKLPEGGVLPSLALGDQAAAGSLCMGFSVNQAPFPFYRTLVVPALEE